MSPEKHLKLGPETTDCCTRAGVETWLVGEVVLLELLGTAARRQKDPGTGFELLQAD